MTRPERIPVLKGKEAKEFDETVASPPSPETPETFRRAREVYRNIKRVSEEEKKEEAAVKCAPQNIAPTLPVAHTATE